MALEAKEVAGQATKIRGQVVDFNYVGLKISEILSTIAQEMEAYDSKLPNTIMDTQNIYEKMRTCIGTKFTELADVMDKWVNNTLTNEETHSETIQSLNDQVK